MSNVDLPNRGVSSIIGIILLVAITVIIGGVTASFVMDISNPLHEPSMAAVDASETTFSETEDCDNAPVEKAVIVTLTNYQQADRIYVIVHSEGGETLKTVWDDPDVGDVGTSILLANDNFEGDGESPDKFGSMDFIDIGKDSGDDISYCPGDEATFEFYAESDGQKTILQRLTI